SRRRRCGQCRRRITDQPAPVLWLARAGPLGAAPPRVGGSTGGTANQCAFQKPGVLTKKPPPPRPTPRKMLQGVESIGGNLEQYSLSAISALAERAVAAFVPR